MTEGIKNKEQNSSALIEKIAVAGFFVVSSAIGGTIGGTLSKISSFVSGTPLIGGICGASVGLISYLASEYLNNVQNYLSKHKLLSKTTINIIDIIKIPLSIVIGVLVTIILGTSLSHLAKLPFEFFSIAASSSFGGAGIMFFGGAAIVFLSCLEILFGLLAKLLSEFCPDEKNT